VTDASTPIWLTTPELADRWRVTTRTIDRWRAARYGPAWHSIGGLIRYSLADVEAFERRQRRVGK
jgi:hypothetical protein